jgi:hypothetical protein
MKNSSASILRVPPAAFLPGSHRQKHEILPYFNDFIRETSLAQHMLLSSVFTRSERKS